MSSACLPAVCPRRTYVGVPQSILHAGWSLEFINWRWEGLYEIKNTGVVDSARLLTADLWEMASSPVAHMCLSFHWTKHLAIGQGGAILTDSHDAVESLHRLRFDGRTPGTPASEENITMLGYHAYMSPRDAAEGLSLLDVLPMHNDPLPNSDYPDLSAREVFR